VTDILAVVAQPRRQQILELVWHGERSAGDIAANIDITFGAVSQHLRVLRDAGLVSLNKQGRQHFYRANKQALGPVALLLESMWHERLLRLKHLVEAEERSND
jgi:DNA-binding transcriptional ArsR family regulator